MQRSIHLRVRGAVPLLLLAAFVSSACAPDATRDAVHVGMIEGRVGNVLERYVDRLIGHAEDTNARLVLIEVDTPGGEAGAMKQIVGRIERSTVPVVTWVGPPGAQAVSAGTFIVMAGHIAVMAPGTSMGAASPILATGQDLPETLGKKVEEDTVAFARGVAELHDRNPDWAEAAVRDAASASPAQALELGIVDLVEPTRESLLNAIHGREVRYLGGTVSTIDVAGAAFVMNPMNRYERVLGFIANPIVVGILLLIGLAGIVVEFISPGLLAPGTVGVLALLLSFMGAGALLPSEAALALLLLGAALVAVEFVVPGGVLGAVGAAALLMALGIWTGQASTAVSATQVALTLLVIVIVVGGAAAFWMRRYSSTTSESGTRLT